MFAFESVPVDSAPRHSKPSSLSIACPIHQLHCFSLQFAGFVNVYGILLERAPGSDSRVRFHSGIDRVFHIHIGKQVLRFLR